MEIGKYGVWMFLDALTAPHSAQFARKVEKLGYSALWIPEAVGREPFAHAGYLAANTERLIFATGIANIWARDPMTMMAGARTLAEVSGGRFLLGIGVSHEPLVHPRTRVRQALLLHARICAEDEVGAVPGGQARRRATHCDRRPASQDACLRRQRHAWHAHLFRAAGAYRQSTLDHGSQGVDLRRAGRDSG